MPFVRSRQPIILRPQGGAPPPQVAHPRPTVVQEIADWLYAAGTGLAIVAAVHAPAPAAAPTAYVRPVVASVEEYPAQAGAVLTTVPRAVPSVRIPPPVVAGVEEASPYPGAIVASVPRSAPPKVSTTPPQVIRSEEPPAYPGSVLGYQPRSVAPLVRITPPLLAGVEELSPYPGTVLANAPRSAPPLVRITPPLVASVEEYSPYGGSVLVQAGRGLPPVGNSHTPAILARVEEFPPYPGEVLQRRPVTLIVYAQTKIRPVQAAVEEWPVYPGSVLVSRPATTTPAPHPPTLAGVEELSPYPGSTIVARPLLAVPAPQAFIRPAIALVEELSPYPGSTIIVRPTTTIVYPSALVRQTMARVEEWLLDTGAAIISATPRAPSIVVVQQTFRQALTAKLNAITELTAIVGTAIYPGALPLTHDLDRDGPALTYTVTSMPRNHHLLGSDGTATATVQLSAWSEQESTSDAIALAIFNAIDGVYNDSSWGNGTITIRSCLHQDESDEPEEPKAGRDEWLRHIPSIYSIKHTVTIPTHS